MYEGRRGTGYVSAEMIRNAPSVLVGLKEMVREPELGADNIETKAATMNRYSFKTIEEKSAAERSIHN